MWDTMGNICKRVQGNLWDLYKEYLWEPNNMENIWVIYMGNIYVGLKQFMGLYGYFCGWANEIKARKFVPQHLALQVTCEQFLLSHTCEFEIW